MNPDVIQFACGHCQSWLTVPAQMAGVAGPCPKCGNHIVSPAATPQAASFEPSPPPQPQWPGAGIQQPAVPSYGQPNPLPQPMPQQPISHEVFPPAPAAPPLVALPVWNKPPTGGLNYPDNGLPGGYPMHSQGMRPNTGLPPQQGGYGAALPPPVAPANPIADLLQQMPQRSQFPEPAGQTGVITRPAAVGGSRLSLLARQLTTPADGGAGLPVAPAPLNATDLPGNQRQAVYDAPDASKSQQVGAMMLKDNMKRGLRVSHSPSRGKAKFALAACLLLVLLGALLWTYRGPLKDVYVQVFPPTVPLPETAVPRPGGPVPGVDKSNAVRKDATPPVSQNNREVVRSGPAPAPEVVKPLPKVVPIPDPQDTSGTKVAQANDEQVKKPEPLPQTSPSSATVQPAKNDRELMTTMVAPRAVLADETEDGSSKPAVPPAPAPTPPNPLLESQQKMVEVGRTKSDAKTEIGAAPAPTPAMAPGVPTCKGLPPVCQPAFDGLVKFLAARKWQDRLKYIQLPEQMEPKLKLYYGSNSDGPIDVDEVQYLRHDDSPQVGKGLHVVFVLFSRNWEYGFPVMVEVTPTDGARVDWLTFIEFKDDMLNKFLSTYMDERVQFHVGIHRTHYFDESIPNLNQKEQFSITSPMANIKGFVFVPKGSPFARRIANTITWDKEDSFVVVELQWRKEGNAKWVEMTNIPQLNWYNAGASQTVKAAPADEAAPPAPAPPGSIAR